jgi:hypothetical protein
MHGPSSHRVWFVFNIQIYLQIASRSHWYNIVVKWNKTQDKGQLQPKLCVCEFWSKNPKYDPTKYECNSLVPIH